MVTQPPVSGEDLGYVDRAARPEGDAMDAELDRLLSGEDPG